MSRRFVIVAASALALFPGFALAQHPYCKPGQRCSLNDIVQESERQELEDRIRAQNNMAPAYRPAPPYQPPQQQRCIVQNGVQYCR